MEMNRYLEYMRERGEGERLGEREKRRFRWAGREGGRLGEKSVQ